jgi:hypothetical protein
MSAYAKKQQRRTTNRKGTWPSARRVLLALRAKQRRGAKATR